MAASFGEQLRLAREARGITLREISEQTRISTRYLEAIESGDLKRLPGGIFNRSFIKAYARYVGFDEQEALEAYARTAREQGTTPDEVSTTPFQSRVYTDNSSVRSPLVTVLLTILILAIISVGGYALVHRWQRDKNAQLNSNAPPSAATQPAPVVNNAATPAPAGFAVQLTAHGLVWVKTRVDDGDSTEGNWKTGETREFKPAQSISIKYARSNAKLLEMTINGRPAKITTTSTTQPIEMVIMKDDYEKFLQ